VEPWEDLAAGQGATVGQELSRGAPDPQGNEPATAGVGTTRPSPRSASSACHASRQARWVLSHVEHEMPPGSGRWRGASNSRSGIVPSGTEGAETGIRRRPARTWTPLRQRAHRSHRWPPDTTAGDTWLIPHSFHFPIPLARAGGTGSEDGAPRPAVFRRGVVAAGPPFSPPRTTVTTQRRLWMPTYTERTRYPALTRTDRPR
jgi:hypothetical protein